MTTLHKFALHQTNGFPPRYFGFPSHPLGCLELEALFLFQGRIQFFLLSWIRIPKLSTLSLSVSLSLSVCVSLCVCLCLSVSLSLSFRPSISSPFSVTLLFHFSFTSHNIHYITPITHHCHANNLPSTDHATTAQQQQQQQQKREKKR